MRKTQKKVDLTDMTQGKKYDLENRRKTVKRRNDPVPNWGGTEVAQKPQQSKKQGGKAELCEGNKRGD